MAMACRGAEITANGNGSTKGTSDRSNPPPPAKPPGGASLYGRLQEGMGFADPRAEALDAVRVRVHRRVISELGPVFYNNLVDQKELRSRVERIVQSALRAEKTPMSAAEAAQVAQIVGDDVLGYGPIERLLNDPTISEIMVNGPDKVYIERNGKIRLPRFPFSTRRTCATSQVASWRRWGAISTSPPPWLTPVNGRFPGQCHLPATGGRWAVPHYP